MDGGNCHSMANGFTHAYRSTARARQRSADMITIWSGAHLLYASAPLRCAKRTSKTFNEAAHLHGDVDMREVAAR